MLAANKGFYSDDEDDGETTREEEAKEANSSTKEDKKGKKKQSSSKKSIQPMAEDHLLLLRCSRPLLQSRNAAVVVAVAVLHFYLAPFAELPRVASALLFALRTSTPEAQHTIMACIANAVATQPSLFTPHLTAFYLKSADSLSVRLLKLEILTSLANSSSTDVNLLLQELQVCVMDPPTPLPPPPPRK
jgi:vesicle coat complex subunit